MSLEEKRGLVCPSYKKMSVYRQCKVMELPRSSYYFKPKGESLFNLQVMNAIDRKFLDCPFYGVERMTDYLRQDLGYLVGYKRVRRLYKLMNLKTIHPKKNLSKLNKADYKFPYLLRNLKIERPAQVWQADITYIPMFKGFMYMFAIIDVYSRKIMSWDVSNTMNAEWCRDVLVDTIQTHGKPEIFNTDQGSQFTSEVFVKALQKNEIKISMDGKGRALALHFGCLPTELDAEQVQDYLYVLQQRSKSPSQTYFKHTVYSLRFLLKTENLPYDHLHLPSISKEKKLPVILSREEIWRMLQHADLLKHRLLIGLIYGCGLRCMEVRNLSLKHLDFDRKLLHIVQSKGKKDRYVPLSEHLIRGLKSYISAEHPTTFLFTGNSKEGKDFDSRYSQRGVQWVVKTVCKKAGILKEVHTHTLRHSYATHLLEDGVNILQVQKLLGHERVESTMEYLHVCQLAQQQVHSPLDTVFALCSRTGK